MTAQNFFCLPSPLANAQRHIFLKVLKVRRRALLQQLQGVLIDGASQHWRRVRPLDHG